MALTRGKVYAVRTLDYFGWFGPAKRYAPGDRLPCIGLEEEGDVAHLFQRSPRSHQNIQHVCSVPKGSVRVEEE